MKNEKTLDFTDFIILLIKWKKFLFLTLSVSAIMIYLAIYFMVEEKYDSKAVIISSEEDVFGGLAGLFSDLPGGLALGMGASSPEMSMYTTLIFSRTMLSEIIDEFNLLTVYEVDTSAVDYFEQAIERLSGNINAEENEFMAYEIEVRSTNSILSADIVNYIVKRLNEKLIELKVKKSSDNRRFLGERLSEIKMNLKNSEDSLNVYQQRTGILNAEEQIKGLLTVYSELETQFITKELELSVMKKIFATDSPELKNIELHVSELGNKISELKHSGSKDKLLLPYNNLSNEALEYYRLMREIEINNRMLQFFLPLYEQARLEEQKHIPLLRVIDYGIPAPKKSYPPRTIFTIIILVGIFSILMLYIFFTENKKLHDSERIKYIKENLFKWNVQK